MKIKPEHLEILKSKINPLDTESIRLTYVNGQFPRAELCRDINKRYRWDLLYMSKIKIGDGKGMPGDLDLYEYMNDDHIDTALRSIVPPLDYTIEEYETWFAKHHTISTK